MRMEILSMLEVLAVMVGLLLLWIMFDRMVPMSF